MIRLDHVTGIMLARIFMIVTTTLGERINVDIAAQSLMVCVIGDCH